MDIFWLFFMLSALQPVIKQRLLEASRKRLLALIEHERKSRIVLLVHRQDVRRVEMRGLEVQHGL